MDRIWTEYEKNYVLELMVIEKDSRRFITESIQLDQELKGFEGHMVFGYQESLTKLISKICEINSVANQNGKGRDDFTKEILIKAKELIA